MWRVISHRMVYPQEEHNLAQTSEAEEFIAPLTSDTEEAAVDLTSETERSLCTLDIKSW